MCAHETLPKCQSGSLTQRGAFLFTKGGESGSVSLLLARARAPRLPLPSPVPGGDAEARMVGSSSDRVRHSGARVVAKDTVGSIHCSPSSHSRDSLGDAPNQGQVLFPRGVLSHA